MRPLLAFPVVVTVILSGCQVARSDNSMSDSEDCTPAGGQCVIGDVICAVPGPQSCGPITPAGLYCCLSQVADCGQPDAVTYVCPSDGGLACKGTAPIPLGTPNYQALEAAGDPDASFPEGCTATFPACNGGRVPQCTCEATSWSCRL
jgi:hypothetical protein